MNLYVSLGKLITDVGQTVPIIRDARLFEPGLAYEISAARLRTLSSVSAQAGVQVQVEILDQGTVVHVPGPWVLDPGSGLTVWGDQGAGRVAVSYIFRERALPLLERRG